MIRAGGARAGRGCPPPQSVHLGRGATSGALVHHEALLRAVMEEAACEVVSSLSWGAMPPREGEQRLQREP